MKISIAIMLLLFTTFTSVSGSQYKPIDRDLIEFIEPLEGLRLHVYNDHGCDVSPNPNGGYYKPKCGFLTVGMGHKLTLSERSSGFIKISRRLIDVNRNISREEAHEIFSFDIKKTESLLAEHTRHSMPRSFYIATMSYLFNCGTNALYKKGKPTEYNIALNTANFEKAVAEMDIVTSGGKVMKALVKRRKIERKLACRELLCQTN